MTAKTKPVKAKPVEPTPYILRPYAGESGFVAGTWMDSYKTSRWAKAHDDQDFFDCQAPVVSTLIDHGTIMLAAHRDKPDTLLGHCVVERTALCPVVHYIYVKGDYRRQGIGRALWTCALEQVGYRKGDRRQVRYSHKMEGEAWRSITGNEGWIYNGYLSFLHHPLEHAT